MAPARRRRPTLATVAASAGVSVGTVSKVLNGRSGVGAEKRALITALLEEYDYIGRRGSLGLRGESGPRSVELVFHGVLTAYALEILQGVIDGARDAGVAVAISVRPNRPGGSARPAEWARELTAAGRCAVIDVVDDVRDGDLIALTRSKLPLVVIDPMNLPHRQVTSVGATNFAGGLAATEHLLQLGHRRVAYQGGRAAMACNQARMHGYRAAMEAAGVPVPVEYVRTGSFQFQDGLDGAAVLLDGPEPPTAIFAASDEMAVGVVEAARARGLRIPEDLSVVGFDDTQMARFSAPPLTTVRQPLREIGTVALRTALRLAAGEKLDSHHVELATELVVRGSTAPLVVRGADRSG